MFDQDFRFDDIHCQSISLSCIGLGHRLCPKTGSDLVLKDSSVTDGIGESVAHSSAVVQHRMSCPLGFDKTWT
jgi:hypothetical protein